MTLEQLDQQVSDLWKQFHDVMKNDPERIVPPDKDRTGPCEDRWLATLTQAERDQYQRYNKRCNDIIDQIRSINKQRQVLLKRN